jgi:endonuclease/exonuclease/phosphatase family metal-dependent hydrolase
MQNQIIKVLCWNVLASEFTFYQSQQHGNGYRKVESVAQTCARYHISYEHILNSDAHIVFLQEVSPHFFNTEISSPFRNQLIPQLHSKYYIFTTDNGKSPGTAVLVHQKLAKYKHELQYYSIEGTKETGGESKSSTLVGIPMKFGKLWSISCHFTWDGSPELRTNHLKKLEALSSSIIGPNDRIVMGGDFNCDRFTSSFWSPLIHQSFLSKLSLVDFGEQTKTSLTGETIFRFYSTLF